MDIILLTIGYPYENKDVFVKNEIEILSKKFDTVWIIPVLEGKIVPDKNYTKTKDTLPDNVHVYDIKYKLKDILKIRKPIMRELYNEINTNLKNNIKSIRWAMHANIISKNILNLIQENNLEKKSTMLYSFWFHYNALAISSLDNEFALKISRAHGYDLYEERGYQPYKQSIISNLDGIYACSKMGKNYLMNKYPNNQFHVSYLGTKHNGDKPNIKKDSNELRIVSCSRVVSIKRIERIIDVLSMIDSYKIKWTHFGDGPVLTELKNYAKENIKSNNITWEFKGSVSNEKILNYYKNNNVNLLLNVSLSEGLPISVVEAISLGIPVIATNVGGTSEIIDHNINGFLINKDFSNKELENMIIKIINMNDEEYSQISENAFEKWNTNFNANINYNNFFDEIIIKSKIAS